ncbi:hypothetical protein OH77DRAFT_1418143 [Trametes cingulata]|nr:hypothetical protein OH77DRAFT_1418143 [Trametes cingulata]
MSRPLTLHVSALNDAEFTTYTSSIHDIVDYDPAHAAAPDYDRLTVGVREARAWLRGRYPTIAPSTLDTILRLFSPDLGPADVVTGGQFFAALRLVSHVLSGREVDPSLVFVQAHPDELASRSPSPLGKQPRVSPKAHPQPIQPTPDPPSPDHNPFFAPAAAPATSSPPKPHLAAHPSQPPVVSPVSAPAPGRPPPPSVPPKPNNPFLNRRGSQDAPPQSAPASTAVFPGSRPSAAPLHTQTHTQSHLIPQESKIPPLPPRKPPILPPPRHASIGAPHAHAQPSREAPPPVPALPTRSVSVSASAGSPHPNVLIQQSLQATRIAQTLKKAEQRLEQERVMEVLKSSSSAAGGMGTMRRVRSRSPVKDGNAGAVAGPGSASTSSAASAGSSAERRQTLHRRVPSLPPRRNLSPPASVAGTARSFEQVATATLSPFKRNALPSDGPPPPPPPPARRFASQNNSPSRTPPRPLADLPPEPPPTHPDRKPAAPSLSEADRPVSSSTPSPRVVRSKSMHHPSPPPVPPPPRRKRPESVQLTPTSVVSESPFANPPTSASSPSNLMLSRHLSLSSTRTKEREREGRERSRDSAFADSLQRTFTSLQLRAQPALDAARYKAEGALSRRGFVQHGAHGPRWMREEGEARLMDDVDGAGGDPYADPDADADADGDALRTGRRSGRGEAERGRTWGEVRDDDSSLDHDPGEDSDRERERVEERARRWREGGVDVAVVDDGKRMVLERDDLKWPAGEGWKTL